MIPDGDFGRRLRSRTSRSGAAGGAGPPSERERRQYFERRRGAERAAGAPFDAGHGQEGDVHLTDGRREERRRGAPAPAASATPPPNQNLSGIVRMYYYGTIMQNKRFFDRDRRELTVVCEWIE